MGINYGFNKVRFPAAVPAGTRVRARAELALGRGARRRLVARGHQVHRRGRGSGQAGLRGRGRRPRADRLKRGPPRYLTVRVPFMPACLVAVDAAEERVGPGLQVDLVERRACSADRCRWQPTVLPLGVLDADVVRRARSGLLKSIVSVPALRRQRGLRDRRAARSGSAARLTRASTATATAAAAVVEVVAAVVAAVVVLLLELPPAARDECERRKGAEAQNEHELSHRRSSVDSGGFA